MALQPLQGIVLDYETRSRADLKKVGAYEYARHPSTEILCVSYGRLDSTLPPLIWAPARNQFKGIGGVLARAQFLSWLTDQDAALVAQNAFFERMITQFVLGQAFPEVLNIPIRRWHDTAALAATHALPRNLEGLGDALKLPIQKDPEGKKLIRRHCIPQKITKKNANEWNDDPDGLTRLAEYCQTDTATERLVFHALPKLHPRERKIWCLNQKLNTRGLHVDRKLVGKIQNMIRMESKLLSRDFSSLSKGRFGPNQRVKILDWLRSEGLPLENLQAKTVADALELSTSDRVKTLLRIRQALSKTSTAKYLAFECRTRSDSRLHDYLLYHGASTGRDSGSGVQPHNFPRGTIKDMEWACRVLGTGDLEWVRALLGVPMAAFASALRGMIRATPGYELFCADFNAIEARVLFWLAGNDAGLTGFHEGRDLYREMAAKIYRVKLKDVTPEQREVGKRAILGCGFGMGWKKFMQTCELFGTPVTPKLAKRAVEAYREEHSAVVTLWRNIERAAIMAVIHRKRVTINKTVWFVRGKFLYCELPSGRRLAYAYPSIRYEDTPWGEKAPRLYHWGVNPKTKKWENSGTYGGRLVENIVQATARDLMKEAELRVEGAGYRSLLTVHDEILAEREKGLGNLEIFERLMAGIPTWAKGCPVKAKGWTGLRYRK